MDTAYRGSGVDIGRGTTYPVVEFRTAAGQVVRCEARSGSPLAGRAVGRPVRVLYDPQNPQKAIVNSFIEIWLPVVILIGTGGLLAVIAIVLGLFAAPPPP